MLFWSGGLGGLLCLLFWLVLCFVLFFRVVFWVVFFGGVGCVLRVFLGLVVWLFVGLPDGWVFESGLVGLLVFVFFYLFVLFGLFVLVVVLWLVCSVLV